MVHEHLANPWEGQYVRNDSRGDGAYEDAYTPGTEAYAKLKADFDVLAGEFLKLQDQCVVVLFRPFHEANGDGSGGTHRTPRNSSSSGGIGIPT